jgi:hypothetical protein
MKLSQCYKGYNSWVGCWRLSLISTKVMIVHICKYNCIYLFIHFILLFFSLRSFINWFVITNISFLYYDYKYFLFILWLQLFPFYTITNISFLYYDYNYFLFILWLQLFPFYTMITIISFLYYDYNYFLMKIQIEQKWVLFSFISTNSM